LNNTYQPAFHGLLSSIAENHPQTARLLGSMEAQFGALAAFHAADVILMMQARVNAWGVEAAGILTEDDLEMLPYFEMMQGNLPALERMVDVLECYAVECEFIPSSLHD